MPLSEHEQRLLEQMERALYAEDPKFASALEGTGLRAHTRRRLWQAVAGFLAGVALLMGGLIAQLVWVSVVGFVVMVAFVVLAAANWRGTRRLALVDPRTGRPAEPAKRRRTRLRRGRASGGGGVVDRMEQRWQRRRDEQRGM